MTITEVPLGPLPSFSTSLMALAMPDFLVTGTMMVAVAPSRLNQVALTSLTMEALSSMALYSGLPRVLRFSRLVWYQSNQSINQEGRRVEQYKKR